MYELVDRIVVIPCHITTVTEKGNNMQEAPCLDSDNAVSECISISFRPSAAEQRLEQGGTKGIDLPWDLIGGYLMYLSRLLVLLAMCLFSIWTSERVFGEYVLILEFVSFACTIYPSFCLLSFTFCTPFIRSLDHRPSTGANKETLKVNSFTTLLELIYWATP